MQLLGAPVGWQISVRKLNCRGFTGLGAQSLVTKIIAARLPTRLWGSVSETALANQPADGTDAA